MVLKHERKLSSQNQLWLHYIATLNAHVMQGAGELPPHMYCSELAHCNHW